MAEDKKKNRKRLVYGILITAAVFIGLLLFLVMSSSYIAVVEERDGQFYKGKNLIICGNTLILRRDPGSSLKKADALKSDPSSYRLSFRSMNDIRNIEIIPRVEEEEEQQGTVDPKYLGRYNVIVQGHAGIMFLREKDGKLSGTIRFPKWGNGAVEYLRGVQINDGRIQFTRSANSNKEIRRLGANYYFTQKFYGRYNASGKKIEGHFINDRKEKHLWEGSR
jgi:hypothetical protein